MRYRLLLLMICGVCMLHAQDTIPPKSLHTDTLQSSAKLLENVTKSLQTADRLFNGVDTLYISPNRYNLTLMFEQSTWFQRYTIGDHKSETRQSVSLAPKANKKVGLYFGWRWLFFGYSIDIDKILQTKNYRSRKEFVFNFYTPKVGFDLFYRKTSQGFKIKSYENFRIPEDSYVDTDFDGISARALGVGAYWVFNNKRFSYPAAYSQSTNQRRSAGSWLLGLHYSSHRINFDHTKLPAPLLANLQKPLKLTHIEYTDYTVSFGYTYNWVFARNWLFNISFMPGVGYKKSKVDVVRNGIRHNINMDLIVRSGIVWNNSKYYIGASLVMETYDYRKETFSLTNSYGALKIYAGFNFWKR